MTDPAFQARIDELAAQLADLKTGIQPSVTAQAALVTSVTTLRSELAAVSAVVSTGTLARNIHAQLDQPASEISANFFLAATPPSTTDVSVQWLKTTDLVSSPAGVMPVTYIQPHPGSQVRPCFSTTPVRQYGRLPCYYHVEGDFAARARLVKDKSVGRDLDRSVPLSDMLERATMGFEMLVRSKDLDDVYRQHALSYMRFLQHVLDLEYARQDYLMILTDEPNNRRALQLAANSSSAGAGISDRFITSGVAEAYRKAGQSVQTQPRSKTVNNQNPASQSSSRDNKRSNKDADSQ